MFCAEPAVQPGSRLRKPLQTKAGGWRFNTMVYASRHGKKAARRCRTVRVTAVILFALLAWIPALSADEHPFLPGSTRAAGMGNTWVANTSPEDALFFNPAFLATEASRFTAIRLRAAANGDGMDLLFGQEGKDIQKWGGHDPHAGETPVAFTQRMSKFDALYGHSGPLFLAYKGEGFGIGLYSSSHGEFAAQDGQTVTFKHDFDVGGIAGLAFRINLDREKRQRLMFGANVKYLIRVRHEADALPLTESAGLVQPLAFSGDFRIGQAIGSDLAGVWQSPNLALGLAVYDWFGTTLSWAAYNGGFEGLDKQLADTHINPNLGIGIAWTPDAVFGIPSYILSGVQFALDVRGFFETHDSFFKMLHAGFESVLLRLITLRAGVNAGSLTGGVGIVLFDALYFDYALSTEERPFFSRRDPPQMHTLSFSVVL